MAGKDKGQLNMSVQVIWYVVNFHSSQELLSGTKDLSRVTSLEICVDTQENTLGNFGKICSTSKHTWYITVAIIAYNFNIWW